MWHAKKIQKATAPDGKLVTRAIGDEMPEVDKWPEHGVGHRNHLEDIGAIEWRGDNKPLRTLAPNDAANKAPEDVVDADPALGDLRTELGVAFDAMGRDVHGRFSRIAERQTAIEARIARLESRQDPAQHNPIASPAPDAPAASSPQGPKPDPSPNKGAPAAPSSRTSQK